MFKIEQTTIFAQEIKKSRFRSIAAPVANEDAAKAFLKSNADPMANHNCWAWRIGQAYRFSDDGEPSGTAGKPILQAIDGQSLDGVIVIVTRWFGGILLGSGGLIRAYGGTAAACLKSAEKVPFVATKPFRLTCLFADLALVEAKLRTIANVSVRSKDFVADGAELIVDIPDQDSRAVGRLIADATSGRAIFAPLD